MGGEDRVQGSLRGVAFGLDLKSYSEIPPGRPSSGAFQQRGQVLGQGRHWEQSGLAGDLDYEEELQEAVPGEVSPAS